ncbi:MAG: energy transducer TonB, partial [Parvularculaceae bacterium]
LVEISICCIRTQECQGAGMNVLSSIAAFALVATAVAPARADVDETPAKPIDHRAPDYPAACLPPVGEEAGPQTVVVNFGVTKDGMTENVRAVESSDPCFEEAAIAAVRRWTYEPRRVNGAAIADDDIEATFTFIYEEATQTEIFDARPVIRVPPQYPGRCQRHAKNSEHVVIEFDVTEKGRPETSGLSIRLISVLKELP